MSEFGPSQSAQESTSRRIINIGKSVLGFVLGNDSSIHGSVSEKVIYHPGEIPHDTPIAELGPLIQRRATAIRNWRESHRTYS
jgi:hypothetical protein